MYNWRFLPAPEGDEEWLTFFRAAAAPAAEFNACPPMEINYRSQLGRFTCDEWARLWWVGENEVSLASLAPGNQPPPPAPKPPLLRANTNAFAYFVSLHKEGALCKNNLLSTSGPSCAALLFCMGARTDLESRQSSRPVWASLRWCPSSTPGSVCSACRNETACVPDWHLHLVSDQITSSLRKYTLLSCHLGEVKIVGVGLLASQTHRDEDDHGSVWRWLALLRWGAALRLRLRLSCPVAVDDVCTVHCGGSMKLRSVGGLLSARRPSWQWAHQTLCSFHASSVFRHHLHGKREFKLPHFFFFFRGKSSRILRYLPRCVCWRINRVPDALLNSSIVTQQHKD